MRLHTNVIYMYYHTNAQARIEVSTNAADSLNVL
jgi:hypothetical protein